MADRMVGVGLHKTNGKLDPQQMGLFYAEERKDLLWGT
jgi:hypothetical protein